MCCCYCCCFFLYFVVVVAFGVFVVFCCILLYFVVFCCILFVVVVVVAVAAFVAVVAVVVAVVVVVALVVAVDAVFSVNSSILVVVNSNMFVVVHRRTLHRSFARSFNAAHTPRTERLTTLCAHYQLLIQTTSSHHLKSPTPCSRIQSNRSSMPSQCCSHTHTHTHTHTAAPFHTSTTHAVSCLRLDNCPTLSPFLAPTHSSICSHTHPCTQHSPQHSF